VVARATTVTLCFAPGDVGEIEVPAGVGTLGLGSTGPGAGSGSWFGRGKKISTVRQSKAEVKGPLDKDIIRRIVRAHNYDVRDCYNRGLVEDPSLAGKVSIQFSVGPRGSVRVATVAGSTLRDENVAKCIAKVVKRWTFPKPEGGGMIVVPFVLELDDRGSGDY
jgi:hypothetical protein